MVGPGRAKKPELEALELDDAFARGVAAARVGEADEGQMYLLEVTRREPEHADAWLWLASVARSPQEKRAHFQRVLELRPGDTEARAGLDRLVEKYGAGILAEAEEPESLRCTWHSDRETLLRCSRCNRPMCTDCARQHPVGMRCKSCMKELRSPVYKVTPKDGLRGFVAGVGASAIATVAVALAGTLPIFFIGLIVAYLAGERIGDAVSWGSGRKRGRAMQWVAIASIVVGAVTAQSVAAFVPNPILHPASGAALSLIIFGSITAHRRLR